MTLGIPTFEVRRVTLLKTLPSEAKKDATNGDATEASKHDASEDERGDASGNVSEGEQAQPHNHSQAYPLHSAMWRDNPILENVLWTYIKEDDLVPLDGLGPASTASCS